LQALVNANFNLWHFVQLYAPTTLAPGRDFWLLRYTSLLEDGSLVVCNLWFFVIFRKVPNFSFSSAA